ncbi:MAG: 5'-nucleotidase C-terminal domain-containing protein [Chitinophagaceae bacterium]|nr:5'-nucleotidase C-terminal domain-containing protein [Oligoflexus sp.]
MKFPLILVLLASVVTSCHKDPDSNTAGPILIDTTGRFEHSNLAGNLMTTAIKEQTGVDIVFYPSSFLDPSKQAIVEKELSDDDIDNHILPLYPTDSDKDQFQTGTLSGRQIREFVLNRTTENYRLDLQVAGLEYDIQFLGGLPTIYQINLTHGIPLVDSKNYRVAISDYAFFNPFPGYRYRNGFDQTFRREESLVSARDALKNFLKTYRTLPLLDEPRASTSSRMRGNYDRPLTIPEIQGRSHLSPYYGYRVKTKGILTAVAHPEGASYTELYLQTPDDGDPKTSNAINVYLTTSRLDLEVGQAIEVGGIVTEIMTYQGMTRTAIRDVDTLNILSANNPLPDAVLIGGPTGLKPPNHYVSTYRGNLNEKAELNLADGIDFWESLEGMRIKVAKPTVVGFRGGQEKFDEPKNNYVTVYVAPDGVSDPSRISDVGGLIPDAEANNYNPEVVRIVDSDLAPNVNPKNYYNVGDKFTYDLEGVLSYQTNTFGDGEYVMFVTGKFSSTSSLIELEKRPKTRLHGDENHLTVATYNVENLAGNRTLRVKKVADSISVNLGCPDIVNLDEIQDSNGTVYTGGSSAELTLQGILSGLTCADAPYYRAINIDPIPMQDGGEPGGNIRVAMIYNSRRVQFTPKGNARALDETTIDDTGALNQNPGRVYPNDRVFTHSRKPLIAEFTFHGQKLFLIGNHMNSKLSDGNLWGVSQPLPYSSEIQRALIVERVTQFEQRLQAKNPNANIIVLGDMNAYYNERSMKLLGSRGLTNLMSYRDLCPPNSWYSINFNGGAANIDHIFVNEALLAKSPEFEIVHFNANYMGKISDHDPSISRYAFP